MIITIDGPAGSGKTTVARLLAEKLQCKILQSGFLYRAAALIILEHYGLLSLSELRTDTVEEFSEQELRMVYDALIDFDFAQLARIDYHYEQDCVTPTLTVDAQVVTAELGRAVMGLPASLLSQHPVIRQWALEKQREIAKKYDLIAEGRDCGSIVFPYAEYKFYLTASVQARVQRVLHDPLRKTSQTPEEIAQSIALRDKHDQERTIAPLVVPEGGVVIDSSDLTIEQVVAKILPIISR